MSHMNDSYTEQRDWLLQTIGESFTKNVVSGKVNRNYVNWAQLNISNDAPLCETCLGLYFTPDQLDETKVCIDSAGKPISATECAKKMSSIVNPIRNTACSGLCTVRVGNIDLSQNIIVNANAAIKPEDIDVDKISSDITKEYKKRYGENSAESTKFSENIKKLVVQIANTSAANINQIISTFQTITVSGPGSEVKDIKMDMAVNAVMSAVINNSSSFSVMNEILQEQIDIVRQEVDNRMTGGLKRALKEGKWTLIGVGIFLLVLVLLISGLLIYRAYGM